MTAPKTRTEAAARGLRHFSTGKECRNGHFAARFVSSGTCVACSAEWRRDNPDKVKAWRRSDPVGATQRMRDWRQKNQERARKTWRADAARKRARNPEQHRAAVAVFQKAFPDKVRAWSRNYRSRERGASGTHTAADVAEILRLQRSRCAYCRKRLRARFHVDHIQPLSRGGSNDRKNLQVTCADCNCRKHAKHPAQFAREKGMLI